MELHNKLGTKPAIQIPYAGVALVAGAALITVGTAIIYLPAGLIILGLLLLVGAIEGLT